MTTRDLIESFRSELTTSLQLDEMVDENTLGDGSSSYTHSTERDYLPPLNTLLGRARWSQQTLNYDAESPRNSYNNGLPTEVLHHSRFNASHARWSEQTLNYMPSPLSAETFAGNKLGPDRLSSYGQTNRSAEQRGSDVYKYRPLVPNRSNVLSLESGKEDTDVVGFRGPDDPLNPKNFGPWRKRGILLSISLITLLSPLSSSIPAPAMGVIAEDLDIKSSVIKELCVSTYILGFAFGPLFLGPLSEVYGRVKILQSGMLFYFIFNLACGFARNAPTLIIMRLLSGMGGSAPLVVGTGVISDCWPLAQRGRVVSIWGLGPLLGPALGPVFGAFIVSGASWRWLFWATSIADAAIQFAAIFLLPETFATTILQKKIKALREYTGQSLRLPADLEKSTTKSLRTALVRPVKLLCTQPIVQLIAVYMAYIFGLFYLILTSFPNVWQGIYDESLQISGLNYLSLGVGYLTGAQLNGFFNDTICRKLKERNNGQHLPEFRIPLIMIGSALMPIGLFWYGWSAKPDVHWIVPNLGIAIFAAGSVFCLQCMQTYIIDCYTRFAASGIAAAVVLRSIAGFVFPLFSPKLYKSLGLGWGTSLLGFLCLLIGVPAPIVFWKYGARLRAASKYAAR